MLQSFIAGKFVTSIVDRLVALQGELCRHCLVRRANLVGIFAVFAGRTLSILPSCLQGDLNSSA